MYRKQIHEEIQYYIDQLREMQPSKSFLDIVLEAAEGSVYTFDNTLLESLKSKYYKLSIKYALVLDHNPDGLPCDTSLYLKQVFQDMLITTPTLGLALKLPFSSARSYMEYTNSFNKLVVNSNIYLVDPKYNKFIYQEV